MFINKSIYVEKISQNTKKSIKVSQRKLTDRVKFQYLK